MPPVLRLQGKAQRPHARLTGNNTVQTISLAYDGHPITIREDGWFNATDAAAKFGKSPYEWQRLPETTAYIEALQSTYGKIPYVKTSKARADRGGGTWLHPKLAVMFARWLDPRFAVWCDGQIDDIVRGNQDRSKLRHISAASAKFLHEIIRDNKLAEGKDPKPHHFSNEHCLVNSLLTGEFRGINRDLLAGWQLDFVGHFDLRDGVLIAKGMSYEERKKLLAAEAATWKTLNARRIHGANDPRLSAA